MSSGFVHRRHVLPGSALRVAGPRRDWWLGLDLRPLSLPVACVGLTILADGMDWRWLLAKANHEAVAPAILALTLALLVAAWRRTRAELVGACAVVAAAFLCREIHFRGSDALVAVTLPIVLLWTWWRWPEIRVTLATWPASSWLAACLCSYALSQVIARRTFRFLPGEQGLHAPLEALLESAAHLLFLWTAWRAWRDPAPAADVRRGHGAGLRGVVRR